MSAIGLGGNTFGKHCDASATQAIVDRALDAGITFFDTAEAYNAGASEELLGRALGRRRHEAVIGTKVGSRREPGSERGGNLTRGRIVERLERSLRRLGTDYVDLYYFHAPDPLTPIEESLRAIDDLVRAGKILHPACSNFAGWQIAEAAGACRAAGLAPLVAVQSQYNLLDRSVETEVLPACAHLGISFVPFAPLAVGFLTGKYKREQPPPPHSRLGSGWNVSKPGFYDEEAWLSGDFYDAADRYAAFARARGHTPAELAIAWLLAKPIVCSVIVGATRLEHVAANAVAAEWQLSSADLAELEQPVARGGDSHAR